MNKLQKAIKALNIYDDCMAEMSFMVGHLNQRRMGEMAYARAVEVCEEAMVAQKILHELDLSSRPEKHTTPEPTVRKPTIDEILDSPTHNDREPRSVYDEPKSR